MKINKRGSQSTNSAQQLIFHNRKNSLNDQQIAMNPLLHLANTSVPEKQMPLPSESQPVLKKIADMVQAADKGSTKNARNPSNPNL